MTDRRQLSKGMTVLSFDGERLGKILRLGETGFVLGHGRIFTTELAIPYDEAIAIEAGVLRLSRRAAELLDPKGAGFSYDKAREFPPRAYIAGAGLGGAGLMNEELRGQRDGLPLANWPPGGAKPAHPGDPSFKATDPSLGTLEEEEPHPRPLPMPAVGIERREASDDDRASVARRPPPDDETDF